jgi:hypothetical protein
MKNRIFTQSSPGKLVDANGDAVGTAPMPKTLDEFIAAAKDGDLIQLRVTTRRQKATKDSFRIARKGQLDEIAEGWDGLAKYFSSLEIADTVCYLTYIRQMIYPDKPESWFAPVLDAIVFRCPDKGGQAVELHEAPLVPPLAGHGEKIPQRQSIMKVENLVEIK